MVIGGEKTPAFSARSLELPPSQTDNTMHIIENSRRHYSRPRVEIEKEISLIMNPAKQQSTQNNPNTSKQAASNQTQKPITNSAANQPGNANSEEQKPKRKRTRTRRKKSTETIATPKQTKNPPTNKKEDDGVSLKIQH